MNLVLLCCGAMVALFVVSVIIFVCFGPNVTSVGLGPQLTAVVLQNIVVFILPVVLLALINKSVEHRKMESSLWTEHGPTLRSIALVVLVYIVALPAMNYIVDWNQNLHLPLPTTGRRYIPQPCAATRSNHPVESYFPSIYEKNSRIYFFL